MMLKLFLLFICCLITLCKSFHITPISYTLLAENIESVVNLAGKVQEKRFFLQISNEASPFFMYVTPCGAPIHWQLFSVDKDMSLSEELDVVSSISTPLEESEKFRLIAGEEDKKRMTFFAHRVPKKVILVVRASSPSASARIFFSPSLFRLEEQYPPLPHDTRLATNVLDDISKKDEVSAQITWKISPQVRNAEPGRYRICTIVSRQDPEFAGMCDDVEEGVEAVKCVPQMNNSVVMGQLWRDRTYYVTVFVRDQKRGSSSAYEVQTIQTPPSPVNEMVSRRKVPRNIPKKQKKSRPRLNLSGISGMSSGGYGRDAFEEAREEELEFETGFTNGGRIRKEAFDLIRKALLDPGPDLVVCDEGHKIKNITAEISNTLGAIQTKRRIVLTGYPLQNNLLEYFCMIDFVRPKYLGLRKSFIERFEKPIKNGQCVDSSKEDIKIALQRTHVLVELVKGFVQRRTHHLLKKILPESKEYVLLLRKSQIQRQLYRNFVLWARDEISMNGDAVFNPLMAFSACSKIWNHPDILFKVVERKRRLEEEKKQAELQKQLNKQQRQQMQQQQQQQQHGMMMMMGQNGMMPGFGAQFQPQNGMQIPNGMFVQNAWPQCNYPVNHSPFTPIPSSPSTPSAAGTPNPSSTKKTRKTRASKKTKSDEEEIEGEEKESRMRYDWTTQLFETYQEGVLENGYKIVVALEILDESTKIGEKILIFSQNLTALDMLEEILRKRQVVKKEKSEHQERWEKNRNYLRLDGTTSGADREKLINRFNSEPGLHLFLISTRAGSLGINLVSANRCIIIDACWNPCHDAQAVCRVYRYGQQKKTFVYRLIMDNSMERSIFNRQISKHGLQQRVVDDAQVDANISQKELETLLMYDESQDIKNDKWDTDDWDFGDTVLDSITKRMSQMFSQKPFLHETLIMESEQSLSEQEKREAQLLFERERRMENYDPLAGLSSSSYYTSTMPSSSSMVGPMPSYQQPQQQQFNGNWNQQQNQFQQQNYQPQQPYQHQFGTPFAGPPKLQMQQPPPHQQPNYQAPPHTLRMNVSQFHHQPGGGHTMTSYQNSYQNNNNSLGPRHQMLPPIDPTAFPGAASSQKPVINPAGAVQNIITDRALVFPVQGQSEQLRPVPMNTPIQLIVPKSGAFVKLADGTICTAEGSVFDNHCKQLREMHKNPMNSMNSTTEVIDLD